MKTFQPARVMEIRQALGLSRAELATRIGASRQLVWAWETGVHVPGSTFLMRLAGLTGANLESFFAESKDRQVRSGPKIGRKSRKRAA